MIGFVDGSHVEDNLAVAVAVVPGSGGVPGLARTYIHHRAQVGLERERSARVRSTRERPTATARRDRREVT